MSRHSFDPEIASQVGVNAAVIFQNIVWWCEKNAANSKNVHDGKVWTYNSIEAFETLFPYLSKKQIRLSLDKLKEAELIEVGNFNKDPRDKTNWYAQKGTMHVPKRAKSCAQKGKPLPDSKPVINNTPKPLEGADDLFSENDEPAQTEPTSDPIEDGFQEFWNDVWPSHKRKGGKADCLKVYRQACEGKHAKADRISPAELNRCAKVYIASVRDLEYLKGPLPWLRLPGWEPFMKQVGEFDWDDLTERQQAMLSDGRVPPSMVVDGQPNDAAKYWIRKLHRREI